MACWYISDWTIVRGCSVASKVLRFFYTKPPWTRARASSRSEERRVTPLPLVAVQREQPLPRNGP